MIRIHREEMMMDLSLRKIHREEMVMDLIHQMIHREVELHHHHHRQLEAMVVMAILEAVEAQVVTLLEMALILVTLTRMQVI